jgi:hypothetical protein
LLRRTELRLRMSIRIDARVQRREILQRRIRWIVAATIGYNLIEAVVAITAGALASSTALIAFGLDSTIEVLSAAAVAWQFTRRDPERWEKGTLRDGSRSNTAPSASSSPPSASSSCRSSPWPNAAQDASWDQQQPSRTRSRP